MSYKKEYADMYDMPVPASKKHTRMPMINRAAQFSPFAALTGFEEFIGEESRLTDIRDGDYEERAAKADDALNYLSLHEKESPGVCIRYFQRDEFKQGGKYLSIKGSFKRFDPFMRMLYLCDGTAIAIDSIDTIEVENYSYDN